MATEWFNAGRVSPVPCGTWDERSEYKRLDVVTAPAGNASYIARRDVPAGIALTADAYWHVMCDAGANIKFAADRLASPFSGTSGMVTCHPVEDYPLEVKTAIEPVLAGSGDPSPDNIRTITGFDSATLTRCGKNLFDYKKYRSYTTNCVVNVSDNSIRIYTTAEKTWAGVNYPYMDIKKGVTYRFSLDLISYASGLMIFCVRNENSKILKSAYGTNLGHYTFEYTPDEDITVYPSIMVTNGDTVKEGDITVSNVQMEIGDEFTDYEPYQGDTFSVEFGQNVYGGTMDWNTGVLTIDRKLMVFDGTESFSRMSDMTNQTKSNIFFYKQTDAAKVGLMSSVCSHFKNTDDTIWSVNYDGAVGIYCDNYAESGNYNNKHFRWGSGSNTVDDFKAYLAAQYAAGTPVQICYALAEPITIQLTPHQILALKGTNSLWSDAGDTSVSGRIAPEWLNEQFRNAIISLGGNV